MKAVRKNWTGNHEFSAPRLHEPRSIAAVQEIVSKAVAVRGLGSQHSFSGIADTRGDQISLVHLNGIELGADADTVTVGGGVTYAQLGVWLHLRGFALSNLASLSNVNVAGAIQTGTHGSGLRSGILATAVAAVDLVTAAGEIVRVTHGSQDHDFSGMIVGLGLLGIVVSLTLYVEPTYMVSQRVYEQIPFRTFNQHLREIFTTGQSVSGFTRWEPDVISQVWIKSRANLDDPPGSAELMNGFGAQEASQNLSFVGNRGPEDFTPQLGALGPWHDRLPHFRVEAIPEKGKEYQAEYFVDIDQGAEALEAVIQLREQLEPVLQVSEIRAVDADTFWLSPAYNRQTLAIEFTWHQDWPALQKVLPSLEHLLEPFAARPHWAKMFAMPPQVALELYPKANAFRNLRAALDPNMKFSNSMLEDF